MAITNVGPGNRLPTEQQTRKAQQGFAGTPTQGRVGGMGQMGGVPQARVPKAKPVPQAPAPAPTADPFAGKSYMEVMGMYRGSTDPRFRRAASQRLSQLGRPTPEAQPAAPVPATPGTTAAADPFAGKSYTEVLGMYRGSTDPQFRRSAKKALDRLRGAPTTTEATAPTGGPTGTQGAGQGPQGPTTVEEYLGTVGQDTTLPEEDINILPEDLWNQILGTLQGPQPEAPTTKLPTQEELGQLFEQRYQQELADLTAGTEERQRKEQLRREQDLINRGISPDSEAYRAEQRALAESRALEAAQARQQARGFAEQGITSEYNRALAAAQEQRAAFEQAQGARYKPLEALAPLVQTQAQLRQNKWATKYQADVQKDLTAMGLASDEKKFFANLNQQDRQFFETLVREDRKTALDQKQWDKTFKESVRQFNENQKLTNKKIEADIQNDKNLTQIQRDQLIELARSNRAQEVLEARKIAAINRGDTKTAADIEANQNAVVQGQIKGYYEAIFPLVGAERAKEMVQDRFGAGGGGIDIGR